MHGRAPAWHVPQQGGARETQVGWRDQARPPPGASALPGEPGREAAEADMQIVGRAGAHRDSLRQKHVIGLQQKLTVEPDLGDGGEAFEVQDLAAAAGEARTIPDVVVVKFERRFAVPLSGGKQRRSERAGHRRGQPRQIGAASPARPRRRLPCGHIPKRPKASGASMTCRNGPWPWRMLVTIHKIARRRAFSAQRAFEAVDHGFVAFLQRVEQGIARIEPATAGDARDLELHGLGAGRDFRGRPG